MSSTYEQKLQMIPLIAVKACNIHSFVLISTMVHGDRLIFSSTVEITLTHVCLTEKLAIVINHTDDLA